MTDEVNIRTDDQRLIFKWQQKLLPWFIIMPTFLIGIFIFLATQQLVRFNEKTQTKTDSALMEKVFSVLEGKRLNAEESDKYMLLTVLTFLEQESTFRRYNQGGLLLMSRIFTKYLGFFTGMILAIVGAVFIIGKIREESANITADVNEMMKFSIISSSPGIIFGILGTLLMLATILKHNDIIVQDSPLYLNTNSIIATELFNLNSKDSVRVRLNPGTFETLEAIYSGKNINTAKKDTTRSH